MAMHNGRPLKKGVTVRQETRIVDGEEKVVDIFDLPQGCKNPYADNVGEKKTVRKTTKPNPAKDVMLEKLIATLSGFSADGNVYKTKEGKYAVRTLEGKWFSMALTANKAEPKDKTVYEPEKPEEEKGE